VTERTSGGARRPVIALHSVFKIYGSGDTAVHAVDGVDLLVERGDYVAIMGASGSGKSTLMNIIGCLDVPTRGRYLIDGVDVRRLDEKRQAIVRNRKIGFIFQSFNLIPRTTAVSNVELPMAYAGIRPGVRRQRALAALEMVGLSSRSGHLPSQLPVGSSNAWRSPGPSPRTRCCCWPTSRPAPSTAPAPRTCWSCSTTSTPRAARWS
jgi:putative ABC transport system ATP-binding protein